MEENNNKLTTSYIISGVLAVAVIVLFVLFFTNKPTHDGMITGPTQTQTITLEDGTVVEQEVPMLPIAYVQSDSIYTAYKFFIERTETMQSNYTKNMTDLQSKDQKLQQDYSKFVQDVQNNRYLSEKDIEQKQVSFQRRDEDIKKAAHQIDQENQLQVRGLSQQLTDSIQNAISTLNADNKYQIIFLNEGLTTILYADKAYDLTEELLTFLNSRYTSEAK